MFAITAGLAAAAPQMVPDPADPGAQLPPEGRSLFDHLVSDGGKYSVPYPFESLVARIESRCGMRSHDACVDAVLIPAGRSLQRAAAAPDFFRHPRVVVAVDREGTARAPVLLKDRLYLGFQEKSSLIEVISYNEAAGRFEFQVVRDYRAGATPRVAYANRVICTACHRNQGPIFSRASWDETNANPRIARLLSKTKPAFHGVRVDRGIDIPNAIDDATDRATLLAAYQLLWREGCAGAPQPIRCRAALFTAVLQYKLAGGRGYDATSESFQRDFARPFAAQWAASWPQGLDIANADIPNRDPLFGDTPLQVSARFDPLEDRDPVETWTDGGEQTQRRLVAGLSTFLAESDARAIDAAFRDDGTRERALRAAITDIERGAAVDETDALSDKPFRRVALMRELFARLRIPAAPWCCLDDGALASSQADASSATNSPQRAAAGLGPLYRHCGACHMGPDAAPPDFLAGDATRVDVAVRQCASRIRARLAMGARPAAMREKSPMPPPAFLQGARVTADQWMRSGELAELMRIAGQLAPASETDARDYESLPPCIRKE